MKKWIIITLTALAVLGAIGPNPRFIEELSIGGGKGDLVDGGADFEKNGAITTDGTINTDATFLTNGTPISSTDLADVANIAILSENETITGDWTYDAGLLHITSAGNAGGAYIASGGFAQGAYQGGAEFTGASISDANAWTARDTDSAGLWALGSTLSFRIDTGLTPGNPYTPTERAKLDATGALTLEGDLAVKGGDITSTAVTLSLNPNSGAGTVKATNDFQMDGDDFIFGSNDVEIKTIASAANKTIRINPIGNTGWNEDITFFRNSTPNPSLSRFQVYVPGTSTVAFYVDAKTGDTTVAGDLNVNGGDIKSTAATATLFATTPTTITIGHTGTTLSMPVGALNLGSIGSTVITLGRAVMGSNLSLQYQSTAVNFTTGNQSIVGVTDTSVARTITLATSSAVLTGAIKIIKDQSGAAGTNNITIVTQGTETIDGASTVVISTNYGVIRVYTNGANWFTF